MAKLLSELCYERIAQLLKESYWDVYSPLCTNPFTVLPEGMVDNIFHYVTQVKTGEMLERSHLQFLLASGRLTKFKLCDLVPNYTQPSKIKCRRSIVTPENLYYILQDLLSSTLNLTVFKLSVSISSEYDTELRDVLNILLSESPNLRLVESNIKFDIRALCNAVHLEELAIMFDLDVHNRIYDFLNVNGQFKPHTSLKCLKVSDLNSDYYIDFDSVLTYCTELISFSCDMSKYIEHFHAQALLNGSSTHQFKLEDIFLNRNLGWPVTPISIYTAGKICPNTTKLRVILQDNFVVLLKHFPNLKQLHLTYDTGYYRRSHRIEEESFDYHNVLDELFKGTTFGYKLTCLEIHNALYVDFSTIGNCCPNLEQLTVSYVCQRNLSQFLPTSFNKLVYLHLDTSDVEADNLIGILSNAVNLRSLQVSKGYQLTDEVLSDILKKNTLSKLETFHLDSCSLSLVGMERLAVCLTSLRYFSLVEYLPLIDSSSGILRIFKEINPKVCITVINDSRRRV